MILSQFNPSPILTTGLPKISVTKSHNLSVSPETLMQSIPGPSWKLRDAYNFTVKTSYGCTQP